MMSTYGAAVATTCASSRSLENFTFFTSTSNISVAFGGMRPCMPYEDTQGGEDDTGCNV